MNSSVTNYFVFYCFVIKYVYSHPALKSIRTHTIQFFFNYRRKYGT
jgi:hypothetical protein